MRVTKIGLVLLTTGAGGSFVPWGVVVTLGVSAMIVGALVLAIALETALDAPVTAGPKARLLPKMHTPPVVAEERRAA